jgi:hypothetical protein
MNMIESNFDMFNENLELKHPFPVTMNMEQLCFTVK